MSTFNSIGGGGNLNLFDELKNTLLKNSKYSEQNTENPKLLRNVVIEDALNMNKELLHILLSNPKLKNHFFTDVEGVFVFDKNKFTWTIENKEFLPDSYTRFKQKIGLIDSNERFISSNNDVVLSFPYKDCVLEGGQTKEDQKRSEIFFNETLAPEDVDCLLAPKVFTNIKKYTKDGEESVAKFSVEDNLVIKGNNLLALSSLLKVYTKKIKLIYIDPPYNTGNDSFLYNDSFNHSSWLSFMKNRLEIAKKLLRNDGIICVQCDDNEQAYLKVLMDEIYGKDCFLNIVSVKSKSSSGASGGGEDKKLKKNIEYLTIFGGPNFYKFNDQYKLVPLTSYMEDLKRNGSSFAYNSVLLNEGDKEYFCSTKDGTGDEIKIYKHSGYIVKTVNQISKEEKIPLEEVYKKYIDKIFTLENAQTSIRTRVLNVTDNFDSFYSAEYKRKSGRDKGNYVSIGFMGRNKRLVSYLSNTCEIKNKVIFKKFKVGTLWDDLSWSSVSKEGNVKLPSGKKPENLLKRIIEMTTDVNDIVLDFFMGSGSTISTAHKLHRRYIGIEQMNYIDSLVVTRMKYVINGDDSGISQQVGWTGGGSFVYCELKELNQKYIKQIQNAGSDPQLIDLYNKISKSKFINIKVKPSNIESNVSDFESLSTESKRKLLIQLLDLNMLYVNYSDIDDEEYQVSAGDKSFNRSFYGD